MALLQVATRQVGDAPSLTQTETGSTTVTPAEPARTVVVDYSDGKTELDVKTGVDSSFASRWMASVAIWLRPWVT